jgi:alpha-acetolactate decarboxylase
MTVTRWCPDVADTVQLSGRTEHSELLAEIEGHFPSQNLFYAIRVTGRFEGMRTRSVIKQAVDRCGWVALTGQHWRRP